MVEAPREVRRALSPRSELEREEVRQLVRNRKARDAALEQRVKAHEALERALRLPNPTQSSRTQKQQGGLWSY